MYWDLLMGALCHEKGLGEFSTGSMYFVNNVLVMLLAMDSTIACNGARPEVSDCVNSLMIL